MRTAEPANARRVALFSSSHTEAAADDEDDRDFDVADDSVREVVTHWQYEHALSALHASMSPSRSLQVTDDATATAHAATSSRVSRLCPARAPLAAMIFKLCPM